MHHVEGLRDCSNLIVVRGTNNSESGQIILEFTADTALIVANNLYHNVSVRLEEAKTSLGHLANVYLVTGV